MCLQTKVEQALSNGLTAPALLSKVTGTADRNGFLRHASGVLDSDFRGHTRDVSRQLATCPHQLVPMLASNCTYGPTVSTLGEKACLSASRPLGPRNQSPQFQAFSSKPECHAVSEAKFASLASERSECQSAKRGCQSKNLHCVSINNMRETVMV